MANFKNKKRNYDAGTITLKDYQTMMSEEAKRVREQFQNAVKLTANVELIITPFQKDIEFCVNLNNEKGERIHSVFAKTSMPVGLMNSACLSDILENTKLEKVRLPSGKTRSFQSAEIPSK